MSKKQKVGGLIPVPTKKDSVLDRLNKRQELRTGIKLSKAPYEQSEADRFLDITLDDYENRHKILEKEFPHRSWRAIDQQVQHWAAKRRPYKISPKRVNRRAGKPWSEGDHWMLHAMTSPGAIKNGAASVEHACAILARPAKEVEPQLLKMLY